MQQPDRCPGGAEHVDCPARGYRLQDKVRYEALVDVPVLLEDVGEHPPQVVDRRLVGVDGDRGVHHDVEPAQVIQAEDIDQKVKEKIIDTIISPIFDFTLMGKLALGRTHWPKLTHPQREKFTQLFAKRLKDSYREKISLYTDEKALLKPAIQKEKTVFIPMQLMSKDKKIDMLYKLRKVDKCWKIYDVEIQGVSIILTYRSQFNDILLKGTVKDILSQLEKPPTR